jgi:hypothetical protein
MLLTQTEIENRYFQHFQHKAACGFDGLMDWSIWNNLVLQLPQLEPFIHDSVVAIGALSKALEIDGSLLDGNAYNRKPSGIAKMYREFALIKYGKAVKTMQAVLVSSKRRQLLVACLLVYCFEVLLNNRHSALSHILAGHYLLRGWLAGIGQARPASHRLLSPDPATIDDELVEVFDRMDL